MSTTDISNTGEQPESPDGGPAAPPYLPRNLFWDLG